jgi:energy-coupling factor transporter transmembrane protein EcfT
MNDAGFYRAGHSCIHRVDPRSKIIATMALSVVILHAGLFSLSLATGVMVIVTAAAGVTTGRLYRASKAALPFLIILFFLHALFTPARTDPFWSVGPVRIGMEGILQGGVLVWRFAMILVAGLLLAMTTSPSLLTEGMEMLLRPLRVVRVSSQDLALMLSLALRFIPTISMEVEVLRDAQRARGSDLLSSGLVSKARSLVALVVPLCLAVFRRCDELVVAMEARGYDGQGRTGLHQPALGKGDVILVVLSLCALAAVFLW